ncbi:hypothetical protein HMN09_00902900 [Mycena chlorophos]|uniref:Uncharacterized protein n=1 Tax=Mycena chlorophos TaxID=658473 RepID=A0A8H6SQ28_MYCCL|nr:hypothetical protein HMN09_00902900 [Mycena chlorophos]
MNFSTVLMSAASCVNNSIFQYAVLAAFITTYTGLRLAAPLAPRRCLDDIEHIIQEATDSLEKAREEHLLRNRQFRLNLELRLIQAQERSSLLRYKLLQQYGVVPSWREYLQWFGHLASELRKCRKEFKDIQLLILTEIESERRSLHLEEASQITDIMARGQASDQG